MNDFIGAGNYWSLAIDILLLVVLMFFMFKFFVSKNNLLVAVFLLVYILAVITFDVLFRLFGIFFYTNKILSIFNIFLIVACCVAYQQDLKALFNRIGKWVNKDNHLSIFSSTEDELKNSAAEIVKACQIMAKNNIGALILIVPKTVPEHIIETGTVLNAVVSSQLLESIFITKTPLHDGAVIIKGDTVLAAGCFLPLSQANSISKELGTRHRAAIGITEESDVLAIIVSEETGIISTVHNGEIKRYVTPEKLTEAIEVAYGLSSDSKNSKFKNLI